MNEVIRKIEEAPSRGNVILGGVLLGIVGIGTGSAVTERAISDLIQDPGDKDKYLVAIFGLGVTAGGALFGRKALRAVLPRRREPWPAWVDDASDGWPVNDRGGAMSEFAGTGTEPMLGVLTQIERNEEKGLPPGHGLPPDALVPKN